MATAQLVCQQCGTVFSLSTSPANIKRRKYCGRQCAGDKFSEIPPLLESLRRRLDERREYCADGCILYTGQNNGIYGQIEYRRRTYLAHRASYMVYKGEVPEGKCVCHSCDTPLCINPDHLWLGSYSDNVRDMIGKGRQRYVPRIKVSNETISAIRAAASTGESQRTIAERYGVSSSYVSMLKSGLRRQEIPSAALPLSQRRNRSS